METHGTSCNPAILVTGIPECLTKEHIWIYFQKSTNGGGEVTNVIHPFKCKPAAALVIFQDANIAKSITSRSHKVLNHPVKVKVLPTEVCGAVTVECLPIVYETLSKSGHLNNLLKELKNGSGLDDVRANGHTLIIRGGWHQVDNARKLLRKYVEDSVHKTRQFVGSNEDLTSTYKSNRMEENTSVSAAKCGHSDSILEDLVKQMKGKINPDYNTDHITKGNHHNSDQSNSASLQSDSEAFRNCHPGSNLEERRTHKGSSRYSTNVSEVGLTHHFKPDTPQNSNASAARQCGLQCSSTFYNDTKIPDVVIKSNPEHFRLQGFSYDLVKYAFRFRRGDIDRIKETYRVSFDRHHDGIIFPSMPVSSQAATELGKLLTYLNKMIITEYIDLPLFTYEEHDKKEGLKTARGLCGNVLIQLVENETKFSITGPEELVKITKNELQMGLLTTDSQFSKTARSNSTSVDTHHIKSFTVDLPVNSSPHYSVGESSKMLSSDEESSDRMQYKSTMQPSRPDVVKHIMSEMIYNVSLEVKSDILAYIKKVERKQYDALCAGCVVKTHTEGELTDVQISGTDNEAIKDLQSFVETVNTKVKRLRVECEHQSPDILKSYIREHELKRVLVKIGEDGKSLILIGKENEAFLAHYKVIEDLGLEITETRKTERHSKSQVIPDTNQTYNSLKQLSYKSNPGNIKKGTQFTCVKPYQYATKEGLRIFIYTGDITKISVSTIVNAANGSLVHEGGVSKAISLAAGHQFQRRSKALFRSDGRLKLSQVRSQDSGNLLSHGCSMVIHANGPEWKYYTDKRSCLRHLRETFLNVLTCAESPGVKSRSLAIPLISSGNSGVPKESCAKELFEAVVEFSGQPRQKIIIEEIHLVNIENSTTEVIVAVFHSETRHISLQLPGNNSTAAFRDVRNKAENVQLRNEEPMDTSDFTIRKQCLHCQRQLVSTRGKETSRMLCEHYPQNQTIVNPKSSYENERSNYYPQSANLKPFKPESNSSKEYNANTMVSAKQNPEQETCPICSDKNVSKKLKCGHEFCNDCIDQWFKQKPVCPICGEIYGMLTGTQPKDGTMDVSYESRLTLPGFERHSAIVIKYKFRDGIQGKEHPNPGKRYSGTLRIAYLPDSRDGREVLYLLKQAFDNRLVFTIGRPTTTGLEDKITWNDIHHKTNTHGGPARFGYPDSGYLSRVKEELAAKGIKK